MRQHVLVPTHKLPHPSAKLEFDQLALVETLAIGCHAVDRAAIEKNEWTLIIGAGPIGLSVIPFAVAAGAKVIVMDVSASRLAFCQNAMGVEHTIDAGKVDPLASLNDLTDNQLPTVVIDATGNPQSMMQTFNFVSHGGRIVFVGLFQGDVTFNDPNFHRRELSILAIAQMPGRRILCADHQAGGGWRDRHWAVDYSSHDQWATGGDDPQMARSRRGGHQGNRGVLKNVKRKSASSGDPGGAGIGWASGEGADQRWELSAQYVAQSAGENCLGQFRRRGWWMRVTILKIDGAAGAD